MTDQPPYSDPDDDPDMKPPRPGMSGAPPGAPRWVKVFGIILIVLVILIVLIGIAGGGEHGPNRHAPSGDLGVPPLHHAVSEYLMPSIDPIL